MAVQVVFASCSYFYLLVTPFDIKNLNYLRKIPVQLGGEFSTATKSLAHRALMVVFFFLHSIEDRKLIRIVLMKTNRDAGNCWTSLLENEYAADPWVQDQMQRKLTLERFQREASQRPPLTACVWCLQIWVMVTKAE